MKLRHRIALAVSSVLFAAAAAAAEWDYDPNGAHGPKHWGEAYEACGIGLEQGGLDIRKATYDRRLANLSFDYKDYASMTVVNNGHTIHTTSRSIN